MPDLTLPKRERIYLRDELRELFSSRKAFISYPYRVIVKALPRQEVPVKMMVSVPKKSFKRAVDRNRLKRLTREAYRLQKQILIDAVNNQSDETILIGFIYIGKEIWSFERIKESVSQALTKLSQSYDGSD